VTPARTAETALNYRLAALLRRQRIAAEGERREGRLQYDCLIDRDADWVAIEAEFAPAREVKADAAGRLEMEVDGRPVRLVVALIYPARLRDVADEQLADALDACDDLQFCFGEIDETHQNLSIPLGGESPVRWGPEETGSVDTLADHLWSKWTEDKSIGEEFDSLVAQLDANVQSAAAIIGRNKSARKNIIRALEFDLLGIDEESSMRAAALILCNAMLFHELLYGLDDIPRPPTSSPDDRENTTRAWREILDINWFPIFEPAFTVLDHMGNLIAQDALDALRPAVSRLAKSNIPARHDLSGRVFHRLLIGGKYLSPNYTTISAAIVLSALALEGIEVDWSDAGQIKRLDITDPACGTGTLLVAAAEEIRRRHYRAALDARQAPADNLDRILLEHTLRGRDVVLAAVHLTAATLAMMETSQTINRTQLAQMSLTVKREDGKPPVAYLGSLDYLSTSNTKPLSLGLPDAPRGVAGRAQIRDEQSPPDKLEAVDLAIVNPPFFKSQGSIIDTADGNKGWKPFFGLMTDPDNAALMRKELQRRLQKFPASMKAGGSAFICLADEALSNRGTLACVLPAVVWTGNSWRGVRKMWAERYHIDWVVLSHDKRYRPKSHGTQGRYYVSMSESTSLAETLIVARRHAGDETRRPTKIVNLAHNPTHPIDANSLVHHLTRLDASSIPDLSDMPGAVCSVQPGADGKPWGEVIQVTLPERQNGETPDIGKFISAASAFSNSGLAQTAWHLAQGELYLPGQDPRRIPVCTVDDLGGTGPAGIQVKGRAAPGDMMPVGRSGYAAIWHHKARLVTHIEGEPNASIVAKKGRESEVNELWRLAGRVHIAKEFRLNTQRAAAVWSAEKMLGVRSWNTLTLNLPAPAAAREKALALWLNSTLGIMLSIAHANRPYPGRIDTPMAGLRDLAVLDVRALDAAACKKADEVWSKVARRALLPFSRANDDSIRQTIDELLAIEILNLSSAAAEEIAALRRRLSAESIVVGVKRFKPRPG